METLLKDLIIKYIQTNNGTFQLHNDTVNEFRDYIYDSKGEYLIGGERVSKFISDFIDLYN